MQYEKEIVILKQMIEESVGRKIVTPTDFSFLTGVIAERCHETLGVTTLKRIWGYIEGYDTMRHSTLSILARCVGYHDWDDFLANYQTKGESSHQVLEQVLDVSKLKVGDTFHCTYFIIRQPLYLDDFVRDNNTPTMFVIGNKGGLSTVERG